MNNAAPNKISLKRAYDPAAPADGYRIYVDQLWPRGLSHVEFHYDEWCKEIAPSAQLRHLLHSDPENRWEEFKSKYRDEILSNPIFKSLVDEVKRHSHVTLLYSSHDSQRNNAVVLKQVLESTI